MSSHDLSADDLTLPVKRVEGETLSDRLTANAYNNILPARYLKKDADGELVEEPEDLFERVAKNIALAEAVYEAENRGVEVRVAPDQLKPDHPRRDELAEEVFGEGVTVDDADAETDLTEDNVNKFAYDTVVPELPPEVRTHVEDVAAEFQEMMEALSFMPNSPTLMNAGDELQQLSACFVDSPADDLTDIHQTAKEAAEVFQCLTAETTVYVEGEGAVSIADVEPGDAIVQRDGDGFRTQTVAETHAYDDAPTRRITTEAGVELTGTPNHRLLVDGEWTEVGDVEPGDALSVRLGWIPDENEATLDVVEAGPQWGANRTVSNEAIADLHAEGLSDYQIAERLDSSPSTVQRRRSGELDLSPNGSGGRRPGRTFDEAEFDRLYEAGRTDAEIGDSLGVGAATVQSVRTARSLEPNGTPAKDVTQPTSLTPGLAELVGLWIGDGSLHADGVRFHLSREAAVERVDALARCLFDTGADRTRSDGCYEVVVHSHEIRRWWIENFGDAKPSSAEASVPRAIWQADHECVSAFLRGLFSADGTLTKGKYPRLYSASDRLIDDVQQLLLGVGIPAKTWERENDDREYCTVAPVGERGLNRYADRVGFADGRDERMRDALDATATRPVEHGAIDGETWHLPVSAVEDAGERTVYDLTVADDPEYVASSVVSHNSGGGMGYAFWKLRPYGDPVGSTGGIASGPITFMRTYDQLCETIAQGGARRGAQMGVMRVSHPDVVEFIHAKNKDVSLAHCLKLNDPDDYTYTSFSEALEEARDLIDEEGRVPEHLRNAVEGHLSNFNISVGVTDGFMEALYAGEEFTFTNPRTGEPHVATEETKEMYERYGLDEYVEVGEALSMPAEVLWERIVEGAHENGEPGVIYLERVNKQHSFDVEEHPEHSILATNPCGEQPLEEYEACNLGHINLSTLAALDAPDWRVWREEHDFDSLEAGVDAFLDEALDQEEFDYRIETGTRFLENVVTMSDFPVEEIAEKVASMRKIGLGVMGLAQLYVQLGVEYGSEPANEIARQLMTRINHGSKAASHDLALDRGSFAEWEDSKYAAPTEYADWFEHHTGEDAAAWEDGYPIRNHNTTTIAPTGTTSMVGNTTGGCEPIYNVAYYKNVSDDVQGEEMLVEFDDYFLRTLEANDVDVEAVKREAQEQMANNEFDGVAGLSTVPDAIGELFVVTGDLSAKQHAAVQTACQAGVDSAISKTVNAPNDSTVEDAKEVFEYIYDHGGKGVTYYRDGTRSKQVLTTRADNAEFADLAEDEAAEALLDEIRDSFGDLQGFLDSEEVRAAVGEDVDDILDVDVEATGAQKRPRPDVLHGVTQRIDTGYGKLYVNINEDERGRPFELFANIGNSGGFTASFTESLAKTISTALRAGVDPEEIADELQGIRSPKVAWDKGEQINSIPDAIGTAMRRYLDGELDRQYPRQQNLTEVADEDAADARDAADGDSVSLDGGAAAEGPNADVESPPESEADAMQDLLDAGEAPECPECGSMDLYYSEGCKTCQGCGWSECS